MLTNAVPAVKLRIAALSIQATAVFVSEPPATVSDETVW